MRPERRVLVVVATCSGLLLAAALWLTPGRAAHAFAARSDASEAGTTRASQGALAQPGLPAAPVTSGRRSFADGGDARGVAATLAPSGGLHLRVLDARLEPLSGALARLCDESRDVVLEAGADEQGRVRLEHVPEGVAFELVLQAEGHAPRRFELAGLAPEEVRDLGDVVLARERRLTGRVVLPDGAAAAAAEVRLRRHRTALAESLEAALMGPGREWSRRSSCDEQGSFLIEDPEPGCWSITASLAGHAAASLERFEIGEGWTECPTLRLGVGRILSGLLRDEEAAAVAGARIALWPSASTPTSPEETSQFLERCACRTDALGAFELRGLGWEELQWIVVDAPGHVMSAFRLPREATRVDWVLPLARSLRGRVLGAAGEPVAEARVRVQPSAAPSGARASVPSSAATRSDAAGVFQLAGLAAGDYLVEALAPQGQTRRTHTLGESSEPLELRLSGAEALVVRVEDEGGAALTGVRASLDPSGDLATVPKDAPDLRTETDAGGVARFAGLARGNYMLRLSHPDYATHVEPFTTSSVGAIELRRTLRPKGALGLRALDLAGAPVASLWVELWRLRDNGGLETVDRRELDAFGCALWKDLVPGSYLVGCSSTGDGLARELSIRAEREPRPSSELRVEVLGGECARATLELTREATLAVLVRRDGAPVAGASLWMTELDEPVELLYRLESRAGAVVSDAHGRARLLPVPPGRYMLCVRADGAGVPRMVELELGAGRREEVVDLPSTSVTGRVLDPRGMPIEAALVRLIPDGVGEGKALVVASFQPKGDPESVPLPVRACLGEAVQRTDALGRYDFRDVGVGGYLLEAQREGYADGRSELFEVHGGERAMRPALVLEEACVLHALVQGSEPIARADEGPQLLELRDGAEQVVAYRALRGDGEYEFRGLAAGEYRLVLGREEGQRRTPPFRVSQGAPSVTTWDLARTP